MLRFLHPIIRAPRPGPVGLMLLVWAAACQGSGSSEADTSAVGADLLRSAAGGAEASETSMSTLQSPPPALAVPQERVPIGELGYTAGSGEAPVRIIEFSDFACGYCRQFHMEVFPTLEEEYIETGKVEWKYVPMILGMFGPNAELAARAGECAMAQDRFPAMRDRLFADQPEWKRARDPLPILSGYAEDLGLDVTAWRRCVEQNQRRDRIASGTAEAVQAGVRGTPTFFVLGYGSIPGSLPLELFRSVLDTVYTDMTSR